MPKDIGVTDLKHLLAVIAVESGLAVMHIEGITPEAPTLEAALAGRKPLGEFEIGQKEIDEAYRFANTAKGSDLDFILMGCPHLTIREMKELAEILDGKKVNGNTKLIAVTTGLLLQQAEDLGYAQAIRKAGGALTKDMCIAFAGTQVRGTVATNSIKAVFFYAGFTSDDSRGRPVRQHGGLREVGAERQMGREDMIMAVFKGKSVSKMGVVEGEALVTKDLVAFWAGTNWETGEIVEVGHDARGKNVAEKILVFPCGKGGAGGNIWILLPVPQRKSAQSPGLQQIAGSDRRGSAARRYAHGLRVRGGRRVADPIGRHRPRRYGQRRCGSRR